MAVGYGGGSGQQIVTCHKSSAEIGGLWTLKEDQVSDDIVAKANFCTTGQPILCGDKIRLEHMETAKNLHSHVITSPLSRKNEVSAYGDDGEGDTSDNWIVECIDKMTGLMVKTKDEIKGTSVI